MTRTEEEILAKAPFTVKLGDQDYPIKPLNIKAQREWRQKLSTELSPIVDSFNRESTKKTMIAGLTGALLDFPEKLADLVFSYAPDLPKEKILEEATEEQIAKAFSSVMSIAFPFLGQLGMVTQLVRTQKP